MSLQITGASGFSNGYINPTNKTESVEKKEFSDALNKAVENNDDKQILNACQEFESYFFKMMFKSLRSTVNIDEKSFIPKSNAEEIFQDMLDEQMCESAAKNGTGIGFSNMMYNQLKMQNIVEF